MGRLAQTLGVTNTTEVRSETIDLGSEHHSGSRMRYTDSNHTVREGLVHHLGGRRVGWKLAR